MKTQTQILDNRLYYTRKIELHRKGKKSRTVRITSILICPLAVKSLILITVRRVHYGKIGKAPTISYQHNEETIMKRHNAFFIKIYPSLYYSKGPRFCKCESKTGRWRTQTTILTHIFLTTLILYSGPHLNFFCFSARGTVSPALGGAQQSFCFELIVTPTGCDCPWLFMTDSQYLCIYNFITPACSSGLWFMQFAYTHKSLVFQ